MIIYRNGHYYDTDKIGKGGKEGISQETDPTIPNWAKSPTKPTYTALEVGALPADTPLFDGDYNSLTNTPTIPSSTSQLNNDANFITQDLVIVNQAFPSSWHTNGTMTQLIYDINHDSTALAGKSYMDTVHISDLPMNMMLAEMKVEIMSLYSQTSKIIVFTITSDDVPPYHWEYTSAYGRTGLWRHWVTPQELETKESIVAISAPVNQTDATLPITALACEVGVYYRIDVAVETLAVTLPAMTDLTTVRTVVIYLTAGTTPAVTISGTAPSGGTAPDVVYLEGSSIESGKSYEINCLWNGLAWVVAGVKIETSNP